ncbi:hypothetical protein GCM10020219_044330 [Nonomuraea dietziae]
MEAIPGTAASSALTTRRMLGTADTRRSARRMRSARSTEVGPEAGTRAIATMTASNQFHGSLKNAPR